MTSCHLNGDSSNGSLEVALIVIYVVGNIVLENIQFETLMNRIEDFYLNVNLLNFFFEREYSEGSELRASQLIQFTSTPNINKYNNNKTLSDRFSAFSIALANHKLYKI